MSLIKTLPAHVSEAWAKDFTYMDYCSYCYKQNITPVASIDYYAACDKLNNAMITDLASIS